MVNRKAPQAKVTSIASLANAIATMHYGDLRQVAEELAKMCAPDNGVRSKPKNAHDYAEMLFDWAQATEENL